MKTKLARRNKNKLTSLYQKAIKSELTLWQMMAVRRSSCDSVMTDRHIRRFGWRPEPNHPARREMPWGPAIPMVSGRGKVVGFTFNYDDQSA